MFNVRSLGERCPDLGHAVTVGAVAAAAFAGWVAIAVSIVAPFAAWNGVVMRDRLPTFEEAIDVEAPRRHAIPQESGTAPVEPASFASPSARDDGRPRPGAARGVPRF